MFTGIIEEIGRIEGIKKGTASVVLQIRAKHVLENTKIGDSIAVNGVCLTVTELYGSGFMADVMHETLNRSSLAHLKVKSNVNLERAMAADGRFGGHMVAGHVDGIGRICEITRDDNAIWYSIETSPEILHYIVEKGSIAIDGISLTVAKVGEKSFAVSTIPHTNAVTTLKEKKTGDIVNLENDIVGKYVEKFMMPYAMKNNQEVSSRIDRNFLAKYGF